MKPFLTAYKCLDDVFRRGAFSGIKLNVYLAETPKEQRPLVTKLVYGVLDKNIELEYKLFSLAEKIKPSVFPVLKIGAYALTYLSMPPYAVINECVETIKALGKGALAGFVNGTLRNYARALESGSFSLPDGEAENVSVKYSFPLWAVKKLIVSHGAEFAEAFLAYEPSDETHLRVNTAKISVPDFLSLLKAKKIPCEKSFLDDGVFTKGEPNVDKSFYVPQSAASMLVVCAIEADGGAVLDLCAAPGGKAVYIAGQNPTATVTACDVRPHRLELVKAYARRMNVKNVSICLSDATVFEKSFEEKFDFVLCDAPCSGFGVFYSKPDIKLFKTESDVSELSRLQKSIIENAARYVKKGGALVYSTCTVFDEENGEVVRHLLENRKDFSFQKFALPRFGEIGGEKQFYPHIEKIEGYYIAKLKRI